MIFICNLEIKSPTVFCLAEDSDRSVGTLHGRALIQLHHLSLSDFLFSISVSLSNSYVNFLLIIKYANNERGDV